VTKADEIDARTAALRDRYRAGAIAEADLDAEIRALAAERAAIRETPAASPARKGDLADRLVFALAGFCSAYQAYRPRE